MYLHFSQWFVYDISSHRLQNACIDIFLRKSKCGKYIPRRIRKWNRETSSGRFAVLFFGEPAKGSKGVELPCKFRMRPDRVHPVQNGMPFCETCLSSPLRFQQFLRGASVGKAASERALLFPHPPPRKNLPKPPRGMIVVLWFFVENGWVENNAPSWRIVFCSSIAGEKSPGFKAAGLPLRQLPEK